VLPLIEIKTPSATFNRNYSAILATLQNGATLYLMLSSLATIMLISIYKKIRWQII
jgi:hypothetical protein